ncbi:MAG: hypothetical protein IT258_01685, partial [Saprospiraceae bacterium]|nr:hypothetical protein [Saprospiraceae bacterium]
AAMGQSQYEKYTLGKTVGDHMVSLQANHIPLHSHTVTGKLAVSTLDADKNDPTGNYFAVTKTTDKEYATAPTASAFMAADMLEVTLGDVVKDPKRPDQFIDYVLPNFQPYLCVNYIICIEGTFPRRP